MERGAAKAAENQDDREQARIRRQADQRDRGDAKHRPGDEQHPRPPSVGEVAERQLRNRVGQLETHLQRAGGGQREIEIRDEQRQQRREDVAVAVEEEVRAGQQQDGAVQSERPFRPAGLCVIAEIAAVGVSRSPRPA